MQIAFLLYPNFGALDVVGPFDVLGRVPGNEAVFVAEQRGPVPDERGACEIVAQATLEEVTEPDIVVVPGGLTTDEDLENPAILEWIREVHAKTQYTTSACNGALLLGSAGLLDGGKATTHWLAREKLATYGAEVINERVVQDGKILTSAGVSAGIDMALQLLRLTHGDQMAKTIQLGLEYDPEPPFDEGSKEKAGPDAIAAVQAGLQSQGITWAAA